MRGKKHILRPGYFLILFLLVLGSGIWIPRLKYMSEAGKLTEDILFTADFRRQPVTEELLKEIKNVDQPEKCLGSTGWRRILGEQRKHFQRWTEADGQCARGGQNLRRRAGQYGMTRSIFQWQRQPTGQMRKLLLKIPGCSGEAIKETGT